ncbi:MAG: 3-phosphoserine/phosphohydroxythreonine transaminase [Phycisphaerales bacterium]|nr:3-phosphoserine/phosphohydroxythreonine transaminase [Phycisphaerales bacterium]
MPPINLNPGPAILPKSVLTKLSSSVINYNGSGLSLLEISHRSDAFIEIIDHVRLLTKKLLNLNDDYQVLCLQGGASLQFSQIPMNFLGTNDTACYCNNGIWGEKAIKAASLYGNVHLASSSKDKDHTYIPKELDIHDSAKYLHITTNNTVEGTQWHTTPPIRIPIIADMSSDILSMQRDFNQFALIYAGAQKNIGVAGATLVILNTKVLKQVPPSERLFPDLLHYTKQIEANSLLNTPPTFAIYACLLTLQWIEQQGGITAIESINEKKATMVYDALDNCNTFDCRVHKADRSKMNIVFYLKQESLMPSFLTFCKNNHIVGIKGHSTKGGCRISLYNALPIEDVEKLCNILHDFHKQQQ